MGGLLLIFSKGEGVRELTKYNKCKRTRKKRG